MQKKNFIRRTRCTCIWMKRNSKITWSESGKFVLDPDESSSSLEETRRLALRGRRPVTGRGPWSSRSGLETGVVWRAVEEREASEAALLVGNELALLLADRGLLWAMLWRTRAAELGRMEGLRKIEERLQLHLAENKNINALGWWEINQIHE